MENTQNWKEIVKKYEKPDALKSSWQIFNTIVPYLLCWVLAYKAFAVSAWLSLAICLVSMLFFVRIFIIFHDCGHGSFFKSRKWRNFWGHVTGVLTFTPYWQWTRTHATHHRHSGNLDKRGIGDIDTVTCEEFKKMSTTDRFWYRIKRNPVLMLFGGPILVFMLLYRFPMKEDGKRERKSVHMTNFFIVVKAVIFSYIFGWKFYLFYEFLSVYLGALFGIYLFYVQHQFEGAYWKNAHEWDYVDACLKGCSYFKLPKILQWGSGNIGFHHIHHLSHRIPNYNLEKAHRENEIFQNPPTLTLASSLKCLNYNLYDQENDELISFSEHKKRFESDLALKEAHV